MPNHKSEGMSQKWEGRVRVAIGSAKDIRRAANDVKSSLIDANNDMRNCLRAGITINRAKATADPSKWAEHFNGHMRVKLTIQSRQMLVMAALSQIVRRNIQLLATINKLNQEVGSNILTKGQSDLLLELATDMKQLTKLLSEITMEGALTEL